MVSWPFLVPRSADPPCRAAFWQFEVLGDLAWTDRYPGREAPPPFSSPGIFQLPLPGVVTCMMISGVVV
jgi:hypothetical protein